MKEENKTNNEVVDTTEKKNESVKKTDTKKTVGEYDFVKEIKKDMVEIKIPVDQLNKHLKTETVFINGYRWTIEKGKNVKVPRAVKEVLENAGII